MLLTTMPMLAVSCSRNARWVGENSFSEASPSTAFIWPSKTTGKTTRLRGSAWKNTEPTGTVSGGTSATRMRRRSRAHWPTKPSPEAQHRRVRVVGGVGVAGQHLQPRRLGVHLVDDALVRVDERHQLGQQQLADRGQVALALQQAGEAGEVGLQPVLLGVAVGGQPQVADHRVDVVLQLGDLAAGVDLDRPGQVALGHRGGHLGDGAHLVGEVLGQQVDVAGQLLPGAGGAGHVGLAAEPALDADLAGHRRHLIGEGRQRAGHVVDGVGQRRHLALGLAR